MTLFPAAERLSSDWRDFRRIEKYAEQGKSSTKELVWSWAHKNKTVGDLLSVLQEMGQQRAISLFRGKELLKTHIATVRIICLIKKTHTQS